MVVGDMLLNRRFDSMCWIGLHYCCGALMLPWPGDGVSPPLRARFDFLVGLC